MAQDAIGEESLSGGVLRGKRGLILGVANARSIAYGIAKAARAAGAEIALTRIAFSPRSAAR